MQKVNFNYEECKELIEHFEGWPDELSLKLIQLRRCYESFNEKDTQVFKEAAKNYGLLLSLRFICILNNPNFKHDQHYNYDKTTDLIWIIIDEINDPDLVFTRDSILGYIELANVYDVDENYYNEVHSNEGRNYKYDILSYYEEIKNARETYSSLENYETADKYLLEKFKILSEKANNIYKKVFK